MSIDRLYYLQISFKIVNYKIEKGMLSLLELRITALNKQQFQQRQNVSLRYQE